MLANYIYQIFINKPDLALNNLQWLISYLATPPLGQDMTQGQF